MTRLINRFKEEDQDTLRILNGKFSQLKVPPEEKLVYTSLDRLNGIIQQLDQHGQPPSDEAKLSKLQEAISLNLSIRRVIKSSWLVGPCQVRCLEVPLSPAEVLACNQLSSRFAFHRFVELTHTGIVAFTPHF